MIYFQNPGEIDIDAAMMLGVNAKTSSDALGYFGTGLKFAIATLLRFDQEVIIWQGETKYVFTTSRMETRGKEFYAICMNDKNLGFTTMLGKNWKLWQAFRELYSNALDEEGFTTDQFQTPSSGTTLITVKGGAINEIWNDRHRYILESSPLEKQINEVTVHPGSGIYNRGILVDPSPTSFAYNIQAKIQLTEDRMLADQWGVHYELCKLFWQLPKTLKFFLQNPNALEHSWPWPSSVDALPECLRILHEQNFDTLPNSLKPMYSSTTPETNVAKWKTLIPSQEKTVEQAKEILRFLGEEVEAPVMLLWPPVPNILGRAKEGKIGLSARIFAESLPRIASTLLEEHIHVSMGVKDHTREMQDVLLELAIKGALVLQANADKNKRKQVLNHKTA